MLVKIFFLFVSDNISFSVCVFSFAIKSIYSCSVVAERKRERYSEREKGREGVIEGE